jgi:hypothetical protein
MDFKNCIGMQASVRSGRKRFLEGLMRDAVLSTSFLLDPASAPAGEVQIAASIAELVVENGSDMLTHTEVHRSILRLPAPPPLNEAIAAASTVFESGLDAHSVGSQPSVDIQRPDDIAAAQDVSLFIEATQYLNFDGTRLAASHPKALIHIQVRPHYLSSSPPSLSNRLV